MIRYWLEEKPEIRRLAAERYFSLEQIKKRVSDTGGFVDLCGIDDVRKVVRDLIPAGDKRAKLANDTMEYTMVKWIAMMAGALRGKVDAILLAGEEEARTYTGMPAWDGFSFED